jgi:hypothetical protein
MNMRKDLRLSLDNPAKNQYERRQPGGPIDSFDTKCIQPSWLQASKKQNTHWEYRHAAGSRAGEGG